MSTLRLSRAAFVLVALTWGLMVFGASVRVNGAGLACPDWPLCFGEVIPTIDFGVFFEFGHRVFAGAVSLLYAALGAAVFRTSTARRTKALWLFGAVVLVVQVILGGLTVLELLAEWTVTSHLLAGSTFCLSILLVGLSLRAETVSAGPESVTWMQRFGAVACAVVLPVQVALGGLVSSSHAGLVCPTWPSCAGSAWFPTFEGAVGLQVSHRAIAYLLGAVVLATFVGSLRNTQLRAPVSLMMGLVLVQIALGIGNVLLRLPVEVTLAHTGVAAWLVLSTTWLNWQVWRAPLSSAAPTGGLVEAR